MQSEAAPELGIRFIQTSRQHTFTTFGTAVSAAFDGPSCAAKIWCAADSWRSGAGAGNRMPNTDLQIDLIASHFVHAQVIVDECFKWAYRRQNIQSLDIEHFLKESFSLRICSARASFPNNCRAGLA